MKKNIVLLCAGGMSTSLLVNKMKATAKEYEYDCDINAYGVSALDDVAPAADIVLLGPQVRFQKKRMQEKYPDKIFIDMDMRNYGTMNGKAILDQVIEILKDK